jgi:hypothetical protein
MTVSQQARESIVPLIVSLILPASLLASVPACGNTSDGYPPVARIGAAPRAIPEADAFHTPVVLDASASADPIDDPEGTHRLSFRWTIIGDEYRIQDGTLNDAKLTVTLVGDRPATVQLTVTDEDGLSSTAQEQLQLTVRP